MRCADRRPGPDSNWRWTPPSPRRRGRLRSERCFQAIEDCIDFADDDRAHGAGPDIEPVRAEDLERPVDRRSHVGFAEGGTGSPEPKLGCASCLLLRMQLNCHADETTPGQGQISHAGNRPQGSPPHHRPGPWACRLPSQPGQLPGTKESGGTPHGFSRKSVLQRQQAPPVQYPQQYALTGDANGFGKSARGIREKLERRNQGRHVVRPVQKRQRKCIAGKVAWPAETAGFVQHRLGNVQADGVEAFFRHPAREVARAATYFKGGARPRKQAEQFSQEILLQEIGTPALARVPILVATRKGRFVEGIG